MLKTSGSTESSIKAGEGVVGDGGDSRARRDKSKLDKSEFNCGKVEVHEFRKKVQEISKSKNSSKSIEMVGSSNFLTLGTKLAFTKLSQALFKTPILYHFDPKHHILIEINVSGYAIGRVLSQLTLDDLGQWHLIAFFSQKMIPAKTRYEMHNGKLLAIVETFKTWKHYPKGSWHEVLVLTDHKNLQ